MSVQFGRCNPDGAPVDRHELDEVRALLAPCGPDGEGRYSKGNLEVLFRALHTTIESRRERQPHVSGSGAVIVWDGRLDNREDLIETLGNELSPDSTDLEIVATGYDRLGTTVFRELIGDWALSVWDARNQSLILAKDFVGTRHLYYCVQNDQITWCTILDPLVVLAKLPWKLEEEYVAGWLSFFPATHLTPYVGIHAVPASSFVRFTRGATNVTKYWDFDLAKRTRYRSDSEYEEHFRVVFSESVRRRLRSDSSVLAELSGGMDSSSIVCMADEIARRQPSPIPAVATVSYYDDSEPNWDERSYFTIVEAKRGRTGFHIDVGKQELVPLQIDEDQFAATPKTIYRSQRASEYFAKCLQETGSRVVLCGIAGDEVTGGVPTPTPELQDLLARARLGRLANRLKVWALEKRKPWFHLFFGAAAGFLPQWVSPTPLVKQAVPWLNARFSRKHRHALEGYPYRLTLSGPLPSFQENVATLEALRRQLGADVPSRFPLYETRYPYLDRSLLEFLFSVPREQLIRPGQRRSLMRRALAGIVPDEILHRRRKAYVSRTPMSVLAGQCAAFSGVRKHALTTAFDIADSPALYQALERVRDGQENRIIQLLRMLEVEAWLAQMVARSVVALDAPIQRQTPLVREASVHKDSAQLDRMVDKLNVNGGQNHGV